MGGFPTLKVPKTGYEERFFAPFPPIKKHIVDNPPNSFYTKIGFLSGDAVYLGIMQIPEVARLSTWLGENSPGDGGDFFLEWLH
jgi:hypothetical protein